MIFGTMFLMTFVCSGIWFDLCCVMFASDFLFFGMLMFFIGFAGVFFNRRSLMLSLMSFELMLLAVGLQFLVVDLILQASFGQIFVLFILAVAAAETAVGLSLLVSYYRVYRSVEVRSLGLFLK